MAAPPELFFTLANTILQHLLNNIWSRFKQESIYLNYINMKGSDSALNVVYNTKNKRMLLRSYNASDSNATLLRSNTAQRPVSYCSSHMFLIGIM